MAKYSDIKGFTVQTLSTDTVASGVSGGAWASGGALNTGRYGEGQGAGTMTAAIFTGGNNGSGGVTVNEYYNGTSWTEQGDTNTAHYNAGQGGTQTSSIIAGGTSNIANTEEWNGSAWTEVNDLNTGRRQFALSSNGNAEAALAFGGYAPPTGGPVGYTNLTESWNGSSWTEVSDLNTSRSSVGATDASYTAALCIGGYRGPPTADRTAFVEQWNGSAWTEIADLNVEKQNVVSSGSVTTALASGGSDTARVAATEFWDGSSWTEIADLSTAREQGGRGGTSTASDSIVSGGWVGSVSDLTEEFTAATVFNQITEGQLYFNSTTNTFKETLLDFPAATWASGGSLNTARRRLVGTGIQTAALALNGIPPSPGISNVVEQYDGSSWTEVAEANSARIDAMAVGTSTDAYFIGGSVPTGSSPTLRDLVEAWDGSSWTETTEFNTARDNAGNAGSTSAAIIFGGYDGSTRVANTEVWNGSAWTEVNDMNTARENFGSAAKGTTTATLAFGGNITASAPYTTKTESWDGTNWTEVNDLNTARNSLGFSGTQIAALAFAGNTPPYTGKTEQWDGSTWTERADLSTSRYAVGAGGASSASAIVFGGDTTAPVANTEEWTADLANKTITAS
jgi:hypothetical protein